MDSEAKAIRAAIIGLGYIGGADQVSGTAIGQLVDNLDGTHFHALSRHPRVRLVAGSSRDPGRRKRFATRSGARVYAEWSELLARETPDLVSVATYAPVHAEITLACVRAGVRVIYCEKPIATRLQDADRMIAACRNAGSLLVINHQRRFHPHFRRLRDMIRDGALGELTSGALQWGGGRLGNVGTHLIDAVRMVTGREVQAASGTLDPTARPDCRGPQFRDPGGWGLLRLDGGLMIFVDAADGGQLPRRLIVNGTRARAVAGPEGVRIEPWDGPATTLPAPASGLSSMDRALAEMVGWLDDEIPVPDTAENAVRTMDAIVGFHVSHERNAAWVTLPLQGADRHRELRSG